MWVFLLRKITKIQMCKKKFKLHFFLLLQGTSLVRAVTRVTRPATHHPRHRTPPPAAPTSGLPTILHPLVTPPHNHVCVTYYITRRFNVVFNLHPALFLN